MSALVYEVESSRAHFEGLLGTVNGFSAFWTAAAAATATATATAASWQQIGLLFVFVKRLNLLCFWVGREQTL